MLTFCMTFGGVITSLEASLVASDRVLVRFDTSIEAAVRKSNLLEPLLPAQGQVRRGDNFDKVHVIEGRVVGHLGSTIERVQVVVCPWHGVLAQPLNCRGRKLRAEAQLVNAMSEVVLLALGSLPIVLKIMDMQVAVAEAAAGGKVKVSNNLVNFKMALNAATLFSLLI
jgi:hypothetical protein